MEKIRANSDTRFRVNPQAQDANSVAARVITTAAPTMTASRQPSASQTSRMTDAVAKTSLVMSCMALSSAVAP